MSSIQQIWRRCMSLAQRCTNMTQLKAIHASFISQGLHHNNYAMSKIIAFCALSNLGSLPYASLLFSHIHSPNLFIYNTLIRAYSRTSRPSLALSYFSLLLTSDSIIAPNHHTFHFVLLACANANQVISGKQIHNWVVKNGLVLSDNHVQTGLVRLYADCKSLDDARKVFDEIPCPDLIQWNVFMNGYVKCDLGYEALDILRKMFESGVQPDMFCITTGLKTCAQTGALSQGKWIHEYVKRRNGIEFDVYVSTALVDMYAKCGCIDMAVEVFEAMPKRNVFSWAAMIGGFAVHGYARKAIHCLGRMQVADGLMPDEIVLLNVLMACTHAGLQDEGQSLFDKMESQYGVIPRYEHYSCLVDLLCRAGRLDEALRLIRGMPMKPLASVWGALLSGCHYHNNIDLAELAVKELLVLENADTDDEDGAYVQLSNIYLNAQRIEDACRMRRMIGDRGIKKTPGCSVIELDGRVTEFVSGDLSHPLQAQICCMLETLSVNFFHGFSVMENLDLDNGCPSFIESIADVPVVLCGTNGNVGLF